MYTPNTHGNTFFLTDMTTTECSICVEPFNKRTRIRIACPTCEVETCSHCIKHFLTNNTITPKCMTCNARWTMEFLRKTLTKSFMDTHYKKHQTGCLLSEADTRIPIFQEELEKQRRIAEKHKEILDLETKIKKMQASITEKYRECSVIRNGTTEKKEREVFFMACPRVDCRGRVSSAYKCGLCTHWFCPECHGDKGTERDGEHECTEDNRETVKLLKQNTKPCPKCFMGIFKVNGCDQMWCVSCHTCFSWNTGHVLTGRVHNPHYFDFMRRNNNGHVPRAVGDIPCGGLPTIYEVQTRVNGWLGSSLFGEQKSKQIMDMYRMVVHMSDVSIPRLHGQTAETDDVQIGVSYLKKAISREEWGQMLFLRARKRERSQQWLDLFQMAVDTSSSLFRDLVGNQRDCDGTLSELNELIVYTNNHIDVLNKQYGTKRKHITSSGDFRF